MKRRGQGAEGVQNLFCTDLSGGQEARGVRNLFCIGKKVGKALRRVRQAQEECSEVAPKGAGRRVSSLNACLILQIPAIGSGEAVAQGDVCFPSQAVKAGNI